MLAKACGYSTTAEMYSAEVKEIMERLFLSKEYVNWDKFSKDRFKFEVIIKHCQEGVSYRITKDSQVYRSHY